MKTPQKEKTTPLGCHANNSEVVPKMYKKLSMFNYYANMSLDLPGLTHPRVLCL